MKHSFRKALTGVCAVGMFAAAAGIAHADFVTITPADVTVVDGVRTKTLDLNGASSVSIGFKLEQEGGDSGNVSRNCNVDSDNPATFAFSSTPSGVTAGNVTFTTCTGGDSTQSSAFAAPVGVYQVTMTQTTARPDITTSAASFTLTVIDTSVVTPPADETAPTINIITPADGATYLLGQHVLAEFSCSDEDGGSGLASCVGTVDDGEPIDTASVGSKTFTVDTADNAGNSDTATHSYTVVYDFDGFYQPLQSMPTRNVVKAGRAIPVKFSLAGDQGVAVIAGVGTAPANCNPTEHTDPLEDTVTAGSSSLQYDAASDTYTYVWKTNSTWANSCRTFTLTLDDGTKHQVTFQFTK